MTITERIREQGCCYDDELPPSVPAGEPLRPPRSVRRRGLVARAADVLRVGRRR